MLIRSFSPWGVGLLALSALLSTLMWPVRPVSAQVQDAITARYTENDDSPVLALTSADPEGMGVHWDITGLDADDFSISQHWELTFRTPPDFEAPTDREMLDDADPAVVVKEGGDNEYHLVVHAIEVRGDRETRRALSSGRDVIVLVRNVDEPGNVGLNRLQPEVGTPVTATLTDGAGIDGEVNWRWYTSKVVDPDPSYDNHWSVVETSATDIYTPRGDRVVGVVSDDADPNAPVDESRYLRVVASYTDGNGAAKRATAMSAHPVRAEVSSDSDVGFGGNPANGSPGFHPGGKYNFSVPENSPIGTPVGEPVVAVDPNDDLLTYELDDTRLDSDQLDSSGDVGAFSIDIATGQLEVAVEDLSYEDRPMEQYRFFVRGVDPSGETAEVGVSISLTDANDPPVIAAITPGSLPPATLWVDEQESEGTDPDAPGTTTLEDALYIFSVTDQDVRGQVSVKLAGEDRAAFLLAETTVEGRGLTALLFESPPDYEEPADRYGNNLYRVTLVATDSAGAETRWPLTVVVDNLPEDGGVTPKAEGSEPLQPKAGQWVHADLTDADGVVAPVTWQWSRGENNAEGTAFRIIPGATGPSYMPAEDDSGYFLRVTATYIDSTSDVDDPLTTHLDERVQKLEGSTIVAKTAGGRHAADGLYRVTSTTVNAVRGPDTDVSDGRAPTGFERASYDREVPENAETGTVVGTPVRVQDHSDSTAYVLEGPFPRDYFTVDRHGQIRVGAVPAPGNAGNLISAPSQATPVATTTDPYLDYEQASSYSLTVRASGSIDDAVTNVNVMLKDLNEMPYFTRKTLEEARSPIAFPERRYNLTVVDLMAVEPDDDGLKWELAGPDALSFTTENGSLEFRERPDFERPGSVAGNNTYIVTVVIIELTAVGGGPLKSAELPLTIEVTNRNDPGAVAFSLLQPEVGTPLTARLLDVDGQVSDTEWTWHLSKVGSPSLGLGTGLADLAAQWRQIPGAQSETYTPAGLDADTSPPHGTARDEGRHLLARVTYTDAIGDANVALAMTALPVGPDVSDAANNEPSFSSGELTITVLESLAVGEPVGPPVVVDRNVDDEVLTYDLDSDFDTQTDVDLTGDVGFFSIDRATGQLSLNKMLSHEATDGRDYADSDSPIAAGIYTLVVRATDPSGEAGGEDSDTMVVRVVATDANEAPRLQKGLTELSVREVDSSREETDRTRYVGLGYVLEEDASSPTLDPGEPNVYRWSDDDAFEMLTWIEPISGPDGGLFEYSSAGSGYGRRLHFRSPPDYERPLDQNGDNVYELTVMVVDRSGAASEKSVKVRVLNVNEAGSLSIKPEQPVAGTPVSATFTDPDGIVTITSWRWATSTVSVSEFPAGSVVDEASTGMFRGTVGEYLWVNVEYRDGASVEDNPVTLIDERNDDPGTLADSAVETDHDTDEVLSSGTDNAVQSLPSGHAQSASSGSAGTSVAIDLEIAENTPGTGYAGFPVAGLGIREMTGVLDNGMFVFAEDHDARGDGYYDELLSPMEDMDDKMDQLALKPGNHLDFEGGSKVYVLELPMASGDPAGAGTVIVNITVKDVNEPPSRPQRSSGQPLATDASPGGGPTFSHSTTTRHVAENTPLGTSIGDPVVATHPDPHEVLSYSIVGEDTTHFEVATSTGQLLTKEPLDYEQRSSYVLDVAASDTSGLVAKTSVTIVVTNVGLDTRYDANDSGTIERDEIIRAISDYFSSGPDAPGRQEILDLISIYLGGAAASGPIATPSPYGAGLKQGAVPTGGT